MKHHTHRGAGKIETEFGTYYICDICQERFVGWKRKIANLWIAQRFFQGRGTVYTSWFNGLANTIQTGGITFLLIQSIFGKMPAIWILPIIWLFQTIGETWLGIKDYKKWKIAQKEALYGFPYSPLGIEQLQRLRNIEKSVCEKLNLPYQKDSIIDLIQKENIKEMPKEKKDGTK
mgnify:CR=1 FL=1